MEQTADNIPFPILIADGGSTKTDWCLATPDSPVTFLRTSGLNPALLDMEKVKTILTTELLPALSTLLPPKQQKIQIYYYGAGCIPEVCTPMKALLESIIPHSQANVATDLLGAAYALCNRRKGIACILGTGANSCLFDGTHITAHIPPLGYILGDEGSATALGKSLLSDLLKGLMPTNLKERFNNHYHLNESEIIRRVYRTPEANRFLASFTPFLQQNHEHPYVKALLSTCFNAFFERNVKPYHTSTEIPVNFVGSIASIFRTDLIKSANTFGFTVEKIIAEPIKDLANYHLSAAQDEYIRKNNIKR